jgi:hypothetical protein
MNKQAIELEAKATRIARKIETLELYLSEKESSRVRRELAKLEKELEALDLQLEELGIN